MVRRRGASARAAGKCRSTSATRSRDTSRSTRASTASTGRAPNSPVSRQRRSRSTSADSPLLAWWRATFARRRAAFASESAFGLVHLDVDVYPITRFCLDFFGPRMVSGGVIVLDDYGTTTCEGVKKAVDEFKETQPRLSCPPPADRTGGRDETRRRELRRQPFRRSRQRQPPA